MVTDGNFWGFSGLPYLPRVPLSMEKQQMTSLHSLYWMLSGGINSSTYVRETRTSRVSLVLVLTNRDSVRCTIVGANSSATNRFARIIFEKYSTAWNQHAAPDNESEQALLKYLLEKCCDNFVLTLRVEPLAKNFYFLLWSRLKFGVVRRLSNK